jgi:hypothetical protein
MRHLLKAFYGALLVMGLAGVVPQPAHAGGYYDTVCNCMRPASEYNTRHVVRAPAQVRTHEHVINHTRVVKRTRLIQENRLVVHVRPIINREVVVHRENTVIRNITLHKVNTTNKLENVFRHEVVNRVVPGSVHVVNEHHEVRGVNCNCYGNGGYHVGHYDGGHYGGGAVVSYRD